ncbi:MAG: DNA adenine methylase [Nitrospirae bacterium]|nr:DNA adenine methylase [Nitrospirota bacterium]
MHVGIIMDGRGAARMTVYDPTRHAAARTDDYVFNQLIPYIGSKRKLLDLIQEAVGYVPVRHGETFLDLFAGSGVVSRFAKQLGFRVIANDWEPYTKPINTTYVACNQVPKFKRLRGYAAALEELNSLRPKKGWVTGHLCPRSDEKYDVSADRMFYMRKNGVRIDAIRSAIQEWRETGLINETEEACLLAPLLYQACYRSNTSGVFKGFHKGWGGQTQTALYRIATDLRLTPAVFHDNGFENAATCQDSESLAKEIKNEVAVAYLDPPYNQHPYGSNYHVLNSIALWDKPSVPNRITRGTKSAIRTDWRTKRRSAYNYRGETVAAYRNLVHSLKAHTILTSYSTDGLIPLEEILRANAERGRVDVVLRGYKRYRVSSQRFSRKPMNVEYIVVLDTRRRCRTSADELAGRVRREERQLLRNHPELRDSAASTAY